MSTPIGRHREPELLEGGCPRAHLLVDVVQPEAHDLRRDREARDSVSFTVMRVAVEAELFVAHRRRVREGAEIGGGAREGGGLKVD